MGRELQVGVPEDLMSTTLRIPVSTKAFNFPIFYILDAPTCWGVCAIRNLLPMLTKPVKTTESVRILSNFPLTS